MRPSLDGCLVSTSTAEPSLEALRLWGSPSLCSARAIERRLVHSLSCLQERVHCLLAGLVMGEPIPAVLRAAHCAAALGRCAEKAISHLQYAVTPASINSTLRWIMKGAASCWRMPDVSMLDAIDGSGINTRRNRLIRKS